MFCSVCGATLQDGVCPACRAAGRVSTAPGAVVQEQSTSGLAIASLICGILWLGFLGSILAVVFGHISLSQIKSAAGRVGGRGMAIAGLILGYLGIAAIPITIIVAAIAIPHMAAIKQQAHAVGAMASLKAMNQALTTYSVDCPDVGFPPSLMALGPPENGGGKGCSAEGLIDKDAANAETTPWLGYLYHYTPDSAKPSMGFTISAEPQPGSGTRYFFMSQDGQLHFSDGAPANAASAIMQ